MDLTRSTLTVRGGNTTGASKRIEPEDVVVARPRGRARASVPDIPEAVGSLDPDVLHNIQRRDPLGQFPQRACDSIEEPVNSRPRGHLLSVDDHREALRVGGRVSPSQRGRHIGAVARVFRGDPATWGSSTGLRSFNAIAGGCAMACGSSSWDTGRRLNLSLVKVCRSSQLTTPPQAAAEWGLTGRRRTTPCSV